jgi:hypothetical protein
MSWASICFIVSTTTLTTISNPVPPRATPDRSGKMIPATVGATATRPRNSAPATVIRKTTRAR